MWVISKEFEFDYGHRVHTQLLNPELSIDTCLACRHLHGHRGKITIHLSAEELDSKGMVVDFKELNWFKKWLDDELDHKMILDINDPSLKYFYPILNDLDDQQPEVSDRLLMFKPEGHSVIWPDYYFHLEGAIREVYEGLVLVNFVPTSENLSKWIFEIVQNKLVGYATVHEVKFYETPKTCSVYKKT